MSSNNSPFEIKIRSPKSPKETGFLAFVLFHDMNHGIQVGNALKEAAENGVTLKMGPIHQMHEVCFLNFSPFFAIF